MTAPLSGPGRGRLYALASAMSFGLVAPLAGLAYAGGASPGAGVMARLLFGLIGAALALSLLRRAWWPRAPEWPATGLVALAWTALTVCYMASFYFIPVSLAVLIFFTFPVLIAILAPLVDGQRPQWAAVAAALLAFAGLALALGPAVDGLDWRGCALAAVAALGATSALILSRRLLAEQDLFGFSFQLHFLCVLAVTAGFVVAGPPGLPDGPRGWLGLAGVGVFYAVAVLLQFGAIRLAGAARASVMFNAEPIVTMLGAALILGEHLASWQIAGAALVVAAVLWSSLRDRVAPVGVVH